jgi:malonyl-CoA/methylmalonyl-CoA synthetase
MPPAFDEVSAPGLPATDDGFAPLFTRLAAATPERMFARIGERTLTFGALDQRSAVLAGWLRRNGVHPRDRVALMLRNGETALAMILAIARTGAVWVPVNTQAVGDNLAYVLKHSGPRIVIAEPDLMQVIAVCGADLQSAMTIEAGALPLGPQSPTLGSAAASVTVDALFAIMYTSGTTGRPKGAMLTHRNLISNAETLVNHWSFTNEDVLLHALPIFHVHGLFVANHCALLSGAKMLWRARFDAKEALQDLRRATVMMGVPTYYTRLLADPAFGRGPCSNVRLFISGSAPLLMETFREFKSRTGHTILERYGMSEAGMITSNPLNGERRGGTVGMPLPGVSVRVAGEQGRALPAGETGAIQIRGENVFIGYWRNPDKTREEFTADGWFRTGDIGVFDRDGYLSILGRAKDLIITGGYNVYPKEIELVVDAMPGVAESAVVGVPDPDFGEAVTAVIVLDPKSVPLTESAVIAHLKTQLANYKVPKRVQFRADLPRNAMGKVQKNILRQQLSSGAPAKSPSV